jgi:hypothetical protein
VHPDSSGTLTYKAVNSHGDRILDFSQVGYMGGGVALPVVPVRRTVKPSGADDTAAIHAALDFVSALPLSNGFRGAVLLAPGTFHVSGTFLIAASGVVLRGSGSGAGGSVVQVTGAGRQLMRIQGSGSPVLGAAPGATITDAYVPSGALSFSVDDATGFKVGDAVMVLRPVTDAWVKFMGMDQLVRNGAPETWLAPGTLHSWERTITAIVGSKISIDIPLSDSFDAAYVKPGATLRAFTYPGRIEQVGIEHVRFETPPRAQGVEFAFVRLGALVDSWLSDVALHNFTNGVWPSATVKRLTLERVVVTHDPTTYVTSLAPFDFWLDSTETLIDRCSSSGGNKIWYLATQDDARGPNVVLNFTGSGTSSHLTAHQRWATGTLVDGGNVRGGLSFGNNGILGDGEGWSMGWGVFWNVTGDALVQAPPGGTNWAIGCTGTAPTAAGLGVYESPDAPVRMKSLYLAQLCERLGPTAVANIGY